MNLKNKLKVFVIKRDDKTKTYYIERLKALTLNESCKAYETVYDVLNVGHKSSEAARIWLFNNRGDVMIKGLE